MTKPNKSILVVSPDNSVAATIGTALAADSSIKIVKQTSTLADMNGSAVKMAVEFDIVLFQTTPDNESDMAAVRTLAKGRRSDTVLVALADDNISLSQARALNHAGVDEVMPMSFVGEEIEGQIAKLDLAATKNTNRGKIIAVAQARGGVGATTVAVNLADQLAGRKKLRRKEVRTSVALVDFDLQFGTVGSFLDLEEQDTLLQLALDGTVPDATFLGQSMVSMENGLSVLAAPSKFAPLDSLRNDQVAGILDTLQRSHDYVVIDLPRALVGWVETILQRLDELVIVTDISVSSIRHCRRLIDFYTAENVTLPIKIVVSGEKKPLIQSALHREASKALERKFDCWLPNDPKAAKAMADKGKPLSEVAARSHLNKAMAPLVKGTKSSPINTPNGSKKAGA